MYFAWCMVDDIYKDLLQTIRKWIEITVSQLQKHLVSTSLKPEALMDCMAKLIAKYFPTQRRYILITNLLKSIYLA